LGAATHLNAGRAHWATSPRGILALWAGVLAGPLVWAANLLAGYAIVPWACGHRNAVPLHLLSLASILIIELRLLTSARAPSRTCQSGRGATSADVPREERIRERTHFMARLGLTSSALFATVIMATEVPRWVFDACR